ncbi:MAG TPA: TMEM175 family protein [Candidatus Angelobacter sp.]|nr:TMEM175 family protein [Candidatus Angelobacter sp.]
MQTETGRIEAFSDGVFAIAITLLVLDLKVPYAVEKGLAAALLKQWPAYLAYVMSYMYIGVMWINHHRLFTHIRRSDDTLLVLNLLLLLGITSVPFPTSVLSSHLGGPQQRTAAIVYDGVYLVIAVLFNLLWRHAVARELLDKNYLQSAAMITKQYAFGPVIYLVCLLTAWISVPISLILNGVLAVFFLIPPHKLAARKA